MKPGDAKKVSAAVEEIKAKHAPPPAPVDGELLPCWHCGKRVGMCETHINEGHLCGSVACKCGATGPQVLVTGDNESAWQVDAIKAWNRRTPSPELERLRAALDESIRLQSHYAGLLNDYDGGKRLVFSTASEWMSRLEETGAIKKGADNGE